MTRLAPLAALGAALVCGSALAQTPRAADPPPATTSPSEPQTAQPAGRSGGPATPAAKRPPERGEPEPPTGDIGY